MDTRIVAKRGATNDVELEKVELIVKRHLSAVLMEDLQSRRTDCEIQ